MEASHHDYVRRPPLRLGEPNEPVGVLNHLGGIAPINTTSSSALDSTRVLLTGSADWIERFGEVLRNRMSASVPIGAPVEETPEVVSKDDVDCLLIDYVLEASTGVGFGPHRDHFASRRAVHDGR